MNKKTLIASAIIIVALGAGLFIMYYYPDDALVTIPSHNNTSITYKNTDYGFNFSLPTSWQGYTVVKNTWVGNALKNTPAPSGPKLLIRHPSWKANAPHEDLPILVFTISQWNSYIAEDFAVSAAPILANELARNNKYVFALPPRWDFDYSLGFKEAQDIIAGDPIDTFNL